MLSKKFLMTIALISVTIGGVATLVRQISLNVWDDGWSLLASVALAAMVGLLLHAPIMIKLQEITTALQRLDQNRPSRALTSLPFGVLEPLVAYVNRMIEEQQSFQNVQGRLYQQISEIAAQEERKRLARDLHDSIKQQVFSININAAAAEAHLDSDMAAAREALVMVKRSAQEAMVEMRALLQQLAPAPLEQSGLVEALREQAEALSYRTGAQVETTFGELPPDNLLPIGIQEALFRITQEALSNIARHARARHVSLALKQHDNETLQLAISDDGQGFDVGHVSSGMGLSNIKRRVADIDGADLALSSQPGQGTSITIHIPLEDKQSEKERIMFQEKVKMAADLVVSKYKRLGLAINCVILGSWGLRYFSAFESVPVRVGAIAIGSGVILVSVVSVVRYGRQWRQARQAFAQLMVDQTDPACHLLRSGIYHMNAVISGFVMFSVWALLSLMNVTNWPGTGGVFACFAVVVYFLATAAWAQHRYLSHVETSQRRDILARMSSQLPNHWMWLIILLISVFMWPENRIIEIYFPATTSAQLDFNFIVALLAALCLNAILWTLVYGYWQRQTPAKPEEAA